MKMIADSYYYYLQNKKGEWPNNWQNKCANKENPEEECKKLIKKEIMTKKSIPQKKNKIVIQLSIDKPIEYTTFTGSLLDLICSFKYLTNKYEFSESPLYGLTIYDNQSDIKQENLKEINELINSMGVSLDLENDIIHFEIKWIFQQLFFPPGLEESFKLIMNNPKITYIIIPIGIILSIGSHSNVLIYDIKNNIIERFEPHGSGYPKNFNYNPNYLDKQIYSKMLEIIKKIKPNHTKLIYKTPLSYIPQIGFQALDNNEITINSNIGDPNGFCTLWCIWYLDYRLKYNEMKPEKLVRNLLKEITYHRIPFRDVIRNYSSAITQFRNSYLQRIGKTINDYGNKKISKKELSHLMELIIE